MPIVKAKGKGKPRNLWSWVDTADEVLQCHVAMVYRLVPPEKACVPGSCRKNCGSNPFCLNAIGESSWLKEINEDWWNNGIDNPDTERRSPDEFVGLKNLGATCYVNSIIQVLFHNQTVRRAVYQWRDPAIPDDTTDWEPTSDIAHLQCLFALLEKSHRKYIDPTPLINCLGLNTIEQQDAQEFAKLFVDLMVRRKVSPVLHHQFCGSYEYITTCQTCKSESRRSAEFSELQLNIQGQASLDTAIKHFLKEEILDGDNKYQCGVCGCLRDAVRSIQLRSLPVALNLQLMRFVFDIKTGHKKKLNTAFRFTDSIQLGDSNSGGQRTYELTAVLIHRGPTAYSGHYIAHVREQSGEGWYRFNDEVTDKMEGKRLQLGTEDDLEGNGTSEKPSSNQKVRAKDFHASKNAYMLVYTERSELETIRDMECVRKEMEKLENKIEGNARTKLENKFINKAEKGLESDSVMMKNSVRNVLDSYDKQLGDGDKKRDVGGIQSDISRNHLSNKLSQRNNLNPDISNRISVATNCDKRDLNSVNIIKSEGIQSNSDNCEASQVNAPKSPVKLMVDIKMCMITESDVVTSSEADMGEPMKSMKYSVSDDLDTNKQSQTVKYIADSLVDAYSKQSGDSHCTITRDTDCVIICDNGKTIQRISDDFTNKRLLDDFTNKLSDDLTNMKPCNVTLQRNAALDSQHISLKQTNSAPCLVTQSDPYDKTIAKSSKKPKVKNIRKAVANVVKLAPCLKRNNSDISTTAKNSVAINEEIMDLKTDEENGLKAAERKRKSEEMSKDCGDVETLGDGDCWQSKKSKTEPVPSTSDTMADTLLPPYVLDYVHRDDAKFEEWAGEITQMRRENVEKGRLLQEEVREMYREMWTTHDSDYEFISQDFLSTWFREAPKAKTIDNTSLLCPHDKLKIEKSHKVKVISKAVADKFYAEFGGGPRLPKDSVCMECVKLRYNKLKLTKKVADDDKLIKSLLKTPVDPSEPQYLVGKQTLKLWRRMVLATLDNTEDTEDNDANYEDQNPSSEALSSQDSNPQNADPMNAENGEETRPISPENTQLRFNEDLLCEHGNLDPKEDRRKAVSEEVWTILHGYFPTHATYTPNSGHCQCCQTSVPVTNTNTDELKLLAKTQKKCLEQLFSNRNRPTFQQSGIDMLYLVTSQFVDQWRAFIKDPKHTEPIEEIVNSHMLCEHGGLIYDVNDIVDIASDVFDRFVLLRVGEWADIQKYFMVDRSVSIQKITDTDSPELTTYLVEPEICVECVRRRRDVANRALYSYRNETLYIRQLTHEARSSQDSNLDLDYSEAPVKKKKCDAPDPYPTLSRVTEDNCRRSTRHRKARGEKHVTVSSDDTLLDLKVKIMCQFGIAPIDQDLSVDGTPLTPNTATLCELKVRAQSIITLTVDDVHDSQIMDTLNASAASSKIETGFLGTSLVN